MYTGRDMARTWSRLPRAGPCIHGAVYEGAHTVHTWPVDAYIFLIFRPAMHSGIAFEPLKRVWTFGLGITHA